ncbi:MAG: helix-turn-helix domain-containing protein [Armatimonadetes bacterium]|nr:helix-turn-helix domain-containing protein [Armatimonadota bacterium]
MLYVRALTDDEHAELERMTKQDVGRVSERARMILLSAQRWPVPQIASTFEMRPATVRYWIRRFEAGGPSALCDQPRSGRPRKATPDVEQAVATLIQGNYSGGGTGRPPSARTCGRPPCVCPHHAAAG